MDDSRPIDDDEKAKTAITTSLGLPSILRQPRIAMAPPVIQPKRVVDPPPFANTFLASNIQQTSQKELEQDGPPPSIDIFRNPLLSEYVISDSSRHSDDGDDGEDYNINTMNRGPRIANNCCMPNHMKGEDRLDDSLHSEEEWAAKKLGSRSKMKHTRRSSEEQTGNPFASPPPAFRTSIRSIAQSDDSEVSCSSNTSPSKKMTRIYSVRDKQELEMENILQTLEDLQHNFVENDNSDERSICNTTASEAAKKEFAVRQFPNGDLFSGNVNVETGDLVYGRMTYALDMEVYEGPFYKGKRHGEGAVCMKMDSAAKFLGRYHEGEMHSGTLIVARNQPSDFTYTGTFFNNDFHGIGSIITQSGTIYQGQFEHGQFHGLGRLRTMDDDDGKKSESVYTGDFIDGLFHGNGTMIYSDGCTYVGTWREGKRVEGIETLPNGDVYEGKFINDCRQGKGTLKTKDGLVTKHGMWDGDVLKEGGELSITFGDGHVYIGDHFDERPHGFGKMEYKAGAVTYEGEFINGFRHGEGRCFFHNTGEEYEGDFVCEEPVDLKIFQHDGPLVEDPNDEGEQVVDQIKYPRITYPTQVVEPPRLRSSELRSSELRSSERSETQRLRSSELRSSDLRSSERSERSETPRLRSSDLRSSDLRSSERSERSEGLNSSQISLLSADTEDSTTMSSRDQTYNTPKKTPRLKNTRQAGSPNELKISIKSLSLSELTSEPPKLYRYQNGDTFKGRLDDDKKRQGPGVYCEKRTGSVYEGDWKDNMRHGVGVLTFASGLEYSGEFFKDSIHGQGTITLIDASVYTGSFFNGLFHGNGTLEDEANKRIYTGEFSNGARDGEGEERYPNGTRYKGEYKNGKRQGFGTLFDPEGNTLYEGNWYEDAWHGKGTVFRHKHAGTSWEGKYEGDLKQGKFCGNGIYTYTDETIIEGQWLDDIPRDGDWTINYPDGSKFYGFATFRLPEDDDASGVSESSKGSTTKTNDVLRIPLPHGFGTLTYKSGQRYIGSFVYGDFDDNNRR